MMWEGATTLLLAFLKMQATKALKAVFPHEIWSVEEYLEYAGDMCFNEVLQTKGMQHSSRWWSEELDEEGAKMLVYEVVLVEIEKFSFQV
jgi:hypothetical protein